MLGSKFSKLVPAVPGCSIADYSINFLCLFSLRVFILSINMMFDFFLQYFYVILCHGNSVILIA